MPNVFNAKETIGMGILVLLFFLVQIESLAGEE